jgi:hypothetical protein
VKSVAVSTQGAAPVATMNFFENRDVNQSFLVAGLWGWLR